MKKTPTEKKKKKQKNKGKSEPSNLTSAQAWSHDTKKYRKVRCDGLL